MRALLTLLLAGFWLGGLFLAVRALDSGPLRGPLGAWTGAATVRAAEREDPPVAPPRSRPLLLSGPVAPALGPFRTDRERYHGFLRRLLLPPRARALDAAGEALAERRLLDYFLEHDPGNDAWDEPPVDPETVS